MKSLAWILLHGEPLTRSAHRPIFPCRFVYVADAGNCAVRLVDSNTGAVSTKWGQTGCPGTPAATAYVDSIYASKVFGSPIRLTLCGGLMRAPGGVVALWVCHAAFGRASLEGDEHHLSRPLGDGRIPELFLPTHDIVNQSMICRWY